MSQVIDPNLDYIKRKIREYMNEIADHLTIGGAKNFDEYQKFVENTLRPRQRRDLDISHEPIPYSNNYRQFR